MKNPTTRFWLVFLLALTLGVALHFLYEWLPSPITALVSPVRESLWEHLKILFFPLLLSGLVLGGKRARLPWLLSLLAVCGLMLLAGWIYHIVLGGEAMAFDLILYGVLMLLGFLLPRVLWPLSEWPGVSAACVLLTFALLAAMICFTFAPPQGLLFADLSAARTFLTIPV